MPVRRRREGERRDINASGILPWRSVPRKRELRAISIAALGTAPLVYHVFIAGA